MKLVSSPVLSAFALSTFQPSLPQVKMQEHQCFACKSLKFKHTAYAHSVAFIPQTHTHTHTQIPPFQYLPTQRCTENPTTTLLNSVNCKFPVNCLEGRFKVSHWQRYKLKWGRTDTNGWACQVRQPSDRTHTPSHKLSCSSF